MDFEAAAEKLQPTAKEQVRSNQFLAGTRTETPEDARRSIQVGRILQIVQDIANDPDTSKADKLAASKLLLDKSLPSLQSLDMSISRDDDTADPIALKARLAMLVEKAGPALLSEILGERAKQLPVTIEQMPAEVGDDRAVDPPKQRSTGS